MQAQGKVKSRLGQGQGQGNVKARSRQGQSNVKARSSQWQCQGKLKKGQAKLRLSWAKLSSNWNWNFVIFHLSYRFLQLVVASGLLGISYTPSIIVLAE